jgi:hypothetical protein
MVVGGLQTRLTDGKSCLIGLLRGSTLIDGPDLKPSATTLGIPRET